MFPSIPSFYNRIPSSSWWQYCLARGYLACSEVCHVTGFCLRRCGSVQFSCSVVSDSLQLHELQALQASLSFTISQRMCKFISIESVMLSKHLIFCYPLLLLPSIFANIMVFSNELALCIRWPKYCSFSFSNRPSSGK